MKEQEVVGTEEVEVAEVASEVVEQEVVPPKLCGLVDTSGENDSLMFLKVAPLAEICLWRKLYRLQNHKTARLDSITDKEQLQYIYWNTTKQAPPESVEELTIACEGLLAKLPIDTTTTEELRKQIAELAPKPETKIQYTKTESEGDTLPATKTSKKAAKKAATKEPKQKREKAAKATPAPRGKYAGMALTATVEENPRREGSNGHKSFQLLLKNPGITYEKFIELGGRATDLAWDIEHKNAKATKAPASA